MEDMYSCKASSWLVQALFRVGNGTTLWFVEGGFLYHDIGVSWYLEPFGGKSPPRSLSSKPTKT